MFIFSIVLIIIGVSILVQFEKSIIHKMVGLEIVILGITLVWLTSTYVVDDLIGNVYGIYIISIVGGESALGLSLIISYYRHYDV